MPCRTFYATVITFRDILIKFVLRSYETEKSTCEGVVTLVVSSRLTCVPPEPGAFAGDLLHEFDVKAGFRNTPICSTETSTASPSFTKIGGFRPYQT
jgi:hypothetical protein